MILLKSVGVLFVASIIIFFGALALPGGEQNIFGLILIIFIYNPILIAGLFFIIFIIIYIKNNPIDKQRDIYSLNEMYNDLLSSGKTLNAIVNSSNANLETKYTALIEKTDNNIKLSVYTNDNKQPLINDFSSINELRTYLAKNTVFLLDDFK